MFFLADGDIAVLTPDGVRVMDLEGNTIQRAVQHITWDPIMAEKWRVQALSCRRKFSSSRAPCVTLCWLPASLSISGKVFLDKMDIQESEFREFTKVKIVACGTSWHAGQTGKFMIEKLAKIPVEVDYGSEFRYQRSDRRFQNSHDLHQPVRRNRGHTRLRSAKPSKKALKTLAICKCLRR